MRTVTIKMTEEDYRAMTRTLHEVAEDVKAGFAESVFNRKALGDAIEEAIDQLDGLAESFS